MKYRIKQVGNSFYPQFQVVWPLWFSFYSGESEDEYDSLEDATEYLNQRIRNDHPQKEIIHNYP